MTGMTLEELKELLLKGKTAQVLEATKELTEIRRQALAIEKEEARAVKAAEEAQALKDRTERDLAIEPLSKALHGVLVGKVALGALAALGALVGVERSVTIVIPIGEPAAMLVTYGAQAKPKPNGDRGKGRQSGKSKEYYGESLGDIFHRLANDQDRIDLAEAQASPDRGNATYSVKAKAMKRWLTEGLVKPI